MWRIKCHVMFCIKCRIICHIMCHIMCRVMCGIMCRDAGRDTLVDLIFLRTVYLPNLKLTKNKTNKQTKPYIEASCCLKNTL